MRHNKWTTFLLFTTLLCLVTSTASAQKPSPYDNFNHRLLDASKWSTVGACFTDDGQELECVREIQYGKLHMAHRNFGGRDSDVGFSFGSVNVYFIDPTSIKSITTDLTVRSIQEVGCAVNPQFGGAAHIDATFFNTGTGDPNDDVGGHIAFGRFISDPAGQLTAYGQISQGNNYFAYFPLGTVSMGTPVTMRLSWDQPRHQFLAGWINGTTHVKTQVPMPYSLPDSSPATNPSKVLTLNTFPSNCTANAAWVFIDADFDNVFAE
jgi:hypothetical protein